MRDGFWGVVGCHHGEPRVEFKAGQARVMDGWHVRELCQFLWRGHANEFQLATLDQSVDGGNALKAHIDLFARQANRCLCGAFVGHVGELDARLRGKERHGNVLRAAVST